VPLPRPMRKLLPNASAADEPSSVGMPCGLFKLNQCFLFPKQSRFDARELHEFDDVVSGYGPVGVLQEPANDDFTIQTRFLFIMAAIYQQP